MYLRLSVVALALTVLAGAGAAAKTYTLQQGVALSGTLNQGVDSRSAAAGTPVTITLAPPYPNSLLKGATLAGFVSNVQRAGQGTEPHIVLAFTRIRFYDGRTKTVHVQLLKDTTVQDKSGKETNAVAKTVAGVFGPAHGAGVALLAKNHKDDITIPAGSTIVVELTQPLAL